MIDFDRSVFDHVLSLEEASASVVDSKVLPEFLSRFNEACGQHGMADRYGLSLTHRHGNVDAGHRLMDFGRTLQPVPLRDEALEIYGYPIRPKTFALRDSQWLPYEFELGQSDDDSADEEFKGEIRRLIEQYAIPNVGLRRYSPLDPEELEVTESGGVSIKLPWNSDTETDSHDYKTTFWAFPSGGLKNYRCACRNTGSPTLPNHNHINGN